MYIVHCRVIADNMCEFQHSSSHVNCHFDARLVSNTRKGRWREKLSKHACYLILVKQFTVSTHQALVQTQLGPEKRSALSVIIAHFWALKVIAKFGVSHFSKFRVTFCHLLCAFLFLCFLQLLLLS